MVVRSTASPHAVEKLYAGSTAMERLSYLPICLEHRQVPSLFQSAIRCWRYLMLSIWFPKLGSLQKVTYKCLPIERHFFALGQAHPWWQCAPHFTTPKLTKILKILLFTVRFIAGTCDCTDTDKTGSENKFNKDRVSREQEDKFFY
jgi:hypothetical protein